MDILRVSYMAEIYVYALRLLMHSLLLQCLHCTSAEYQDYAMSPEADTLTDPSKLVVTLPNTSTA